jgi:DNA polymerase-3 subunit epsilon
MRDATNARNARSSSSVKLFQEPAELPLSCLPALALDFQATGSEPSKHALLEMGWARIGRDLRVESFVCRLPDGVTLSRRVGRATGLTENDVTSGHAVVDIWKKLRDAARPLEDETGRCPVVVHYARFEERFLRWLHYHYARDERFPFRVVCTHRIAARLFPELPRQSLRAVAGFLGHALPEKRRAGDHVAATCTVWARSVELLEASYGVRTLSDLFVWLDGAGAGGLRRRESVLVPPMRREAWEGFPDRPGVYRMLRDNGDVLYVGKATSLRTRVRSYFAPSARHAAHIREMLSQAAGMDVVVTSSALEAALEESDAIKQHSPPYNKALRVRDRRLLYATKDLKSFSERPDEQHTLGPLIDHSLWRVVSALARSDEQRPAAGDVLSSPVRSDGAFEEALERFFDCLNPNAASVSRALLARGAELWLRRAEEKSNESEAETETEFHLESPESARARPEAVGELLDDATLRAAHLVRRAHWLRLIASSRLTWASRDGETSHVLVLCGGRVRERLSLALGSPPPPLVGASWELQGRVELDLSVYDRLVVLTREIRRLVREGRPLTLRISNPNAPLIEIESPRLASMLSWI